MINNIAKRIRAFSLAEVLVTMLILMIVTLVSAPVITKKRIKNERPHGVWECKLDANMRHVSTTTIEKQPVITSLPGDFCTFGPQVNAERYSVNVIGGGGGGASGTTFSVDAASYGNSVGYKVAADGQYDVLVVGGGGGGSAKLRSMGNRGGGAGGVLVKKNYNLRKGDYCVLEAGIGGVAGGSPDVTNTGTDSEEEIQHCRRSIFSTWRPICEGKDGKSSTFYVFSSNSELKASGGIGGKQSGNAANGEPYVCTSQRSNGALGGKIFNGGNCADARDFLKANNLAAANFGAGGSGASSSSAYPGYNGVVMLISSSFHSGGGGSRGATSYMTLEKIKDPIKVTVGQGGAGAITEDTNGEQGQNSSFGSYITSKGGAGGEIQFQSSAVKGGFLSGENGAISPYGGSLSGGASTSHMNGYNDMDVANGVVVGGATTFGAGGGGGAARSRFSCNVSNGYAGCWGKGGRGMPGFVRVEWN